MENTQVHSICENNIIRSFAYEKMREDYEFDGCLRLAVAILEQTCRDYVSALRKIKKYTNIKKPTIYERNSLLSALKEKAQCEAFYRSRKFQIYTLGQCNLTPDEVMKEIRRKYKLED